MCAAESASYIKKTGSDPFSCSLWKFDKTDIPIISSHTQSTRSEYLLLLGTPVWSSSCMDKDSAQLLALLDQSSEHSSDRISLKQMVNQSLSWARKMHMLDSFPT
ncbi:hypothetical protein GOODEAATRI_031559 [Goodea atripinnis]|uniref:Uncharacterized protein n=1 Tax=Goodea atripinnis TaxID=208336 RepID=A0ABV0NF91_9TELE